MSEWVLVVDVYNKWKMNVLQGRLKVLIDVYKKWNSREAGNELGYRTD
jgi:hypothetical protein